MESSSPRSNPTIDRISNMPDSVLCHILSFLPTKDASSTSVLSKRWKFVWLSVLALHFDDKTFKDFKTFRQIFYLIMFKLRDKRTSILSFNFKLGDSSRFNQKEFNRIFKFVMQRGVQNLDFNMFDKSHCIKLPQRVFNLKTLQVLKLTHLTMRDFDRVDFPRPKTLRVHRVDFLSLEYFAKFLFGCPVLEDLYTKEIFSYRLTQSRVPIENLNALPNLVKVRIFCDFYMNTPMTLVCKAKILHIKQMQISLTRLPTFLNLTHLELSVHDIHCNDKCTCLLAILPHFPKLQHLIIQNCGTEKNTCYNNIGKHPHTTPECISSQLKTCCIRGYKGTKHEFEFAKYIIHHSKVLETMIVKSNTYLSKDQKLELSSCTRGSTRFKLLFNY